MVTRLEHRHETDKINSSNNSNNNSSNNKNVPKTKKHVADRDEYGGDDESLKYRSGIPTLRSSAHRVKFSPKHRTHDPKPRDKDGRETNTTWLPKELLVEDVFQYDPKEYDLRGSIGSILNRCNPDIVGSFPNNDHVGKKGDNESFQLEDFSVPVSSLWRSVNGGCCEDAQKYLSDSVNTDTEFLEVFDRFVEQVALPYLKQRLIHAAKITNENDLVTFYYQRPPTLRLQPGPAWAKVKPHHDAEYGHQNGELNFWIPLTDRTKTGVDLWSESSSQANDYHPIPARFGEVISFHGSSCRHYVNTNSNKWTRVSLDFRVGVQGYFDPMWQSKGTTNDHGRREVQL